MTALGENLVTDSAAADVVEMRNSLSGDELANSLVSGRGLFRFGRNTVIQDNHDPVRVPNSGHPDLSEALTDQVGVFVRERDVHIGHDDLFRLH